jgi:hypothetical protein
MAAIELEVEGSGAIAATQELTQLEGLSVTYETEGVETKRYVYTVGCGMGRRTFGA